MTHENNERNEPTQQHNDQQNSRQDNPHGQASPSGQAVQGPQGSPAPAQGEGRSGGAPHRDPRNRGPRGRRPRNRGRRDGRGGNRNNRPRREPREARPTESPGTDFAAPAAAAKREILITLEANEKRVAILEDGRLEELYMERLSGNQMFGNIYKGIVKTVIPGIGAAFVDLGTKKDGFLYVADALRSPLDIEAEFDETEGGKPRQKHRRERVRQIQDVLKVGQEIIVQVVKESIGNKGPRLTTHFSIPARFLVMMPGEHKVGVSRRIENREERERIRQVFAKADAPPGAGFIVRTAGEGKSETEYTRDIRYLSRIWKTVQAMIEKKKAPALIHQELDIVERVIRDHLTEDTERIIVDNKDVLKKVKRFMTLYLPGAKIPIEIYSANVPLFEKYNVEAEATRTLEKTVMLKSGGHIVIEQTESLVAIDVNTGKFTGTRNLEETVFKTNLEACDEVARQLRLRDVGGIIIIDFIDMEKHEHRRALFRRFKDAVRRDRAKTNILQISDLGLVEMTRQRMKPSLESAVHKECPYCEGKGFVKSQVTMSIQTLKEIRKSLAHTKGRTVNAYVHPEVAERLLHQEKNSLHKLEKETGSRIFIFSEVGSHIEDVNITFVK